MPFGSFFTTSVYSFFTASARVEALPSHDLASQHGFRGQGLLTINELKGGNLGLLGLLGLLKVTSSIFGWQV
jgi:hypothetical protein